jgi:hypothetical protein
LINGRLGRKFKSIRNNKMYVLSFFRNTFLISLANVLTSIFAGFVIFAYLGYLAYITGQGVEDVVSQGKL